MDTKLLGDADHNNQRHASSWNWGSCRIMWPSILKGQLHWVDGSPFLPFRVFTVGAKGLKAHCAAICKEHFKAHLKIIIVRRALLTSKAVSCQVLFPASRILPLSPFQVDCRQARSGRKWSQPRFFTNHYRHGSMSLHPTGPTFTEIGLAHVLNRRKWALGQHEFSATSKTTDIRWWWRKLC